MDYRAFEPFKNFIDDYIIHLKWGVSGKLFDLNKHTFGDVAIIKKKNHENCEPKSKVFKNLISDFPISTVNSFVVENSRETSDKAQSTFETKILETVIEKIETNTEKIVEEKFSEHTEKILNNPTNLQQIFNEKRFQSNTYNEEQISIFENNINNVKNQYVTKNELSKVQNTIIQNNSDKISEVEKTLEEKDKFLKDFLNS